MTTALQISVSWGDLAKQVLAILDRSDPDE